ncbi:MAG: hypothetical protein A3B37_02835 [Candidatus Sungbacteria bacterium RIFCSPLOWO2_01_FULL_59_16]|uniref:Rrf2 family transcriptional regulator n=1 Tax=Candidatus Sungbacteria bacterium RIFCSPLOWO2_01_FULL_59_16 TaxID=1802280 RepID=A0A1G2L9G3_9BACT|nr:MAG: hypothetical protein A3B37_02835 [Candidatus Sungbacteria bacterium RIFCSPLOWO2_01_FULL_59_16]
MQFSRNIDYACIFLASLRPTFRSGRYYSLAGIAAREHLPLAFLERIAGTLRLRGVVEARKGSEGGYRLIRDPKRLTLKDILAIFEMPPVMRCLRSSDPEKHCLLAEHCPTRKTWYSIERRLNKVYEGVTVAEL